MNFIPKYIRQQVNNSPRSVVTSDRWNELWNLAITQGDYNSGTLDALINGPGAESIGATAVGNGTATTVQGILEEIDTAAVHKTGDETIAGVKTFSDSPIVPAPTANTQAATKKYVDDKDASVVHKDVDGENITGLKNFIGSFNVVSVNNNLQGAVGAAGDALYLGASDQSTSPTKSASLRIEPSNERNALLFRGGTDYTYKKVWHEGNDGTGSGLDADKLDGKHDADMVHKAGTETITGVKTFSSSPIVPAPTTDTQASTKKYVDDADVLKVNITDIVNDLTTGGMAVPLSAEQGKVLKENSDTHIADTLKHKQAAFIVQSGILANAEGDSTIASGDFSHAEGSGTIASGDFSHASGYETEASGSFSHAEGYDTKASGNNAHSEGDGTEASGFCSHAEGNLTLSSGSCAHAEGSGTIASGDFSHASGYETEASGSFSHAEGSGTKASNYSSHAEGADTVASGPMSHAEGSGTKASNYSSHAEGADTVASGPMSHAEGQGTIAEGTAQHVQGQFNVPNPDLAMIIGGGTDDADRKNILTVDWDGNLGIAGNLDLSAGKKVKIDGQDMSAINIGAVATTDIVNNLTTTVAGKVLDARQGKILDDKVGTNATSIGTLASLTTTEKTNLVGAINELDTDKVETSAITNTLTETSTGKVLDARQGKTLSDKIGNQTYTEDNYVTDAESVTASLDKLDMAVKDTAELVSTKESITNVAAYLKNISPVCGILWGKGETPTLTRTDASVNMVANIGIDAQVVRNDFDSAPIYRDMVVVEDTLGNKFIRIPKFYIKKTDSTNYKQWQVSPYKHDGYYLPWCFWDFTNSRELPYIDVGKYNASLNGTKLASVANTYPLINKNIVEFRTYAKNNNAGGLLGYQQLDVHVIDVLRTLFFIEFATLDSQSIMKGFMEGQYATIHLATATEVGANRIVVANAHAGLYRVGQTISVGTTQGGNQKFYGRTITGITVVDGSNKAIKFDGDPVDIATGNFLYNTGWKSGFSSNIVASSGTIVANDGKYPCSYRGIENPFGNVWQFVDGVNITDNQAWVAKNAADYASNVFASPYEKLSYVNHNANGYGPVEMGFDSNLPFAEFATNVTGGSTAKHYCDYYYQAAGSRIALFGGSWINGSDAGLSYWTLNNTSSTAHVILGGRLIRKAL